jgi:hypothetical protein
MCHPTDYDERTESDSKRSIFSAFESLYEWSKRYSERIGIILNHSINKYFESFVYVFLWS